MWGLTAQQQQQKTAGMPTLLALKQVRQLQRDPRPASTVACSGFGNLMFGTGFSAASTVTCLGTSQGDLRGTQGNLWCTAAGQTMSDKVCCSMACRRKFTCRSGSMAETFRSPLNCGSGMQLTCACAQTMPSSHIRHRQAHGSTRKCSTAVSLPCYIAPASQPGCM